MNDAQLEIIALLIDSGRPLSASEMQSMIGLGSGPFWVAMDQLENAGKITGEFVLDACLSRRRVYRIKEVI